MKKIISSIVFCLIFVPAISLAYSTDAEIIKGLQSQISALLDKVQQLQTQLNQMQNGQTTSWCHTFNTDLGVGSSGDEVYALSLMLQKEGYNLGKFDSYDENAASKISNFQEKYRSEILTPAGLSSPTGYVGARTRAKLNSLYGCGVIKPTPTPNSNPVACTMDARVCPDGSYVGRTGPYCEFSTCPTTSTKIVPQTPKILYPQGDETLQSDTVNYISWNPVSYSGTFDISIIGVSSGNNYSIVRNVTAQATDKQSVQWTPRVGMYEKDTQFIAQVCRTGTNLCSKSNKFNISFPLLIPSESNFSFSLTQGNPNPPVYNLHLTNSSLASINFTLSVPNKPSWLNCSYNTETMIISPGGVMGVCVAVDATKVSGVGTYTTNLIVSGNFTGSPISIPITLTVKD